MLNLVKLRRGSRFQCTKKSNSFSSRRWKWSLLMNVMRNLKFNPSNGFLGIKRFPSSNTPTAYRAPLVSASLRTELCHWVHCNSPTVGLHTIRILLALFTTCFKITEKELEKLIFFTSDARKAFLQSDHNMRLVYYEPSPEFRNLSQNWFGNIWRACTQRYGAVEAGLYWNRTFVLRLCNNSLDLK